jgi:hypothetical protein
MPTPSGRDWFAPRFPGTATPLVVLPPAPVGKRSRVDADEAVLVPSRRVESASAETEAPPAKATNAEEQPPPDADEPAREPEPQPDEAPVGAEQPREEPVREEPVEDAPADEPVAAEPLHVEVAPEQPRNVEPAVADRAHDAPATNAAP